MSSATWSPGNTIQSEARQSKVVHSSDSSQRENPRTLANIFGFIAGVFLVGSAWNVFQGNLYSSRSNFGFYLGVAGSLFMLAALLGYPLRKHLKFMKNWGAIKHWFRIHMALGIIGPTLILYHATFHVRSLNAGVALASMLLVVTSGLIGRFLYSRIHFGLYGQRASLTKLQDELITSSQNATSWLTDFPRIVRRLKNFERSVLKTRWPFPENILQLLTVGIRRKFVALLCGIELRFRFSKASHTGLPANPTEASNLLSQYLINIQRVAQFTTYERIFSLWHVLHVPFLFILAASSIFHVIAVYMY